MIPHNTTQSIDQALNKANLLAFLQKRHHDLNYQLGQARLLNNLPERYLLPLEGRVTELQAVISLIDRANVVGIQS